MQKFTGKEYLKIDIASLYGLDKKTWSERLAWFDQNQDNLEALSSKADSPNCYIAAVNAWRDVQAGKPIGYAINLDATASGIQILALLIGDAKAAEQVNLIATGKREDLYTYIYNKMLEKAPDISSHLTRDMVKKAIMTSCYGSEKKPKEVFGEKNYTIFEEVMHEELPGVWGLNKFLLNHWKSNKDCYSWVMPDNFHVDAHVVNTCYYESKILNYKITFSKKVVEPTQKGRFLSANLAHSVDGFINREIICRCSYSKAYKDELKKLLDLNAILSDFGTKYHNQPKDNLAMFKTLWKCYEKSGFLSARILQYISIPALKLVGTKGINDIRRLVESLPEGEAFEVYSIHDCFRCLPNHGNDLRQQYLNICSQIAESRMLDDIVTNMLGEEFHFKKLSTNLGELVLQAEYPIC